MHLGRPRENQSVVTIHHGKSPEDNAHLENGKVFNGRPLESLDKSEELASQKGLSIRERKRERERERERERGKSVLIYRPF